MLHRIFLAINLHEKAKKTLSSYKEKWPELPARWSIPENIHITLLFLGNTSKVELKELQKMTSEIAARHTPFCLYFSQIVYGPSVKQPRMLWAIGERSNELHVLQKDLASQFHKTYENAFSLHVTLARLKEWEFQKMEQEERPIIPEAISLEVPVNTIDIMESKLKRSGAEYSIIETMPL